MSVLQHSDSINVLDLQVWKHNAAFDTGDGNESKLIQDSWSPVERVFTNGSESVLSSKENRSPGFCISPVCENSPTPLKPLFTGNVQGKPLKVLFKQGLLPVPNVSEVRDEVVRYDSNIDNQIEEIEKEIKLLSSKLESLRLERSLRDSIKSEEPTLVQSGKVVGQKPISKAPGVPRKVEQTPVNSRRRGVTMGPAEIAAGVRSYQRLKQEMTPVPSSIKSRRGISLGPSEILAGIKSQQKGKQEITPIQSTQQSRRKSCFFKLKEIDEGKVTKERGGTRSSSLSPKSRISKIQPSRQGYATMGAKKPSKKDDKVISSIQSKKLFKEGEKVAPIRKPAVAAGRVIASRYNQIPVQNAGNLTEIARRKMSLPGNARVDIKKIEIKRPTSVGKSRVTENQVEIPSETVDNKSLGSSQPPSILKFVGLLPKISTIRCTNDTPRDSGAAKKVAELCGKKSYFSTEEEEEEEDWDAGTSICQTLCFDEEED